MRPEQALAKEIYNWATKGKLPDPQVYEQYLMPASVPARYAGSWNHFPLAFTCEYIRDSSATERPSQFLEDQLATAGGHGLHGGEQNSPMYRVLISSCVAIVGMIARYRRHFARDRGHDAIFDMAQLWLDREAALLATMTLGHRPSGAIHVNGEPISLPDDQLEMGPHVFMPGLRASEGDALRSPGSSALFALYMGSEKIPFRLKKSKNPGTWERLLLSVAAMMKERVLLGCGLLSEDVRYACHSLITDAGHDYERVRFLYDRCLRYIRQRVPLTIRRYVDGSMAAWIHHNGNGNTPPLWAAVYDAYGDGGGGDYDILKMTSWKAHGIEQGDVTEDKDDIALVGTYKGKQQRVYLPDADIAWEILVCDSACTLVYPVPEAPVDDEKPVPPPVVNQPPKQSWWESFLDALEELLDWP